MLFIASLIATISAAYLYDKYEKTCAEIAIACVAIVIIGLVLTLVVAPWQIQLLLLLGIALSSLQATKLGL